MSKKIAVLGTQPGDDTTEIGVSSDYTTAIPSNKSSAIDDLMNQAECCMKRDSARYDLHFSIWLSLFSLKNRLPWETVKK